jgi:hypothetical protein
MPSYLQLFHGRKHPYEILEDWGEEGPIIGPLDYIHTTYAAEIKFEVSGKSDSYGWLTICGDLVYYDGNYYGDWSSFTELPQALTSKLIEFDQSKATLPKDPPHPPIDVVYLKQLLETIQQHRNDPDPVFTVSEYSENSETLNQIEEQVFREDLEREAQDLIECLINETLTIISSDNQAGSLILPELLGPIYASFNSAYPNTVISMIGNYVRQNIDAVVAEVAPEASSTEHSAIKISLLYEADKMDSESFQFPTP